MPARYKILVVEDSPANAGAFSALLRLAGYRTATATDGPSGLIQMAVDTPDLILLDHYLPAMNSTIFLREMRKATQWQSIPAVIVTGADMEEIVKIEAALAGGLGPGIVLQKPVEPGNLLAVLPAFLPPRPPVAVPQTAPPGVPDFALVLTEGAMNDPQKTPPPAGETGEGRAGLNDPHEQSGQSQQQAQQAEHQVHHGLRSHGLDDHTIQQAKARGMDLHGLLSLLQLKGPQVRELVTAILGLFGSQGGAGPQPGA
jgi:CheY-like chemotaxis protein